MKTRILRKTWLKFCLFLLMVVISPHLFAQITVNEQNKPIKEILKVIESKSVYRFFYNEGLNGLDKMSSLNVNNAGIDATMNALLRNSEITYKLEGNNFVALIAKEVEKQVSAKRITGNVKDEFGIPVIGATIMTKGSKVGTITNYNGDFTLEANPNETLVISSVGYVGQELRLNNQSTVNIKLKEDVKTLSEVVVTALGIKREQKALGYSVQQVSGEELQKVSGTEIGTSLTGKVSGLLVKNSTDFGITPTITIRGESPIIVIDGVPYTNKKMSDISAADVESMSVLKGSTASALYGEKGMYGAILITTKNGSGAQDGISVDVSTNTMFTAGFLAIPKKQSMYGRGTNNSYNKTSDSSWGQLMDGSIQNQWDPFLMDYRDYEYLPVGKDNFKNFLEQGYATNNNISVAYKTGQSAVRSSINWVETKGQYPNSKLDKYSYSLGGDINLQKFTLSSNLSYSKKVIPNLGSNGYTSYDPMYSLLIWSGSDFNILDYKDNYWLIKDQVQNYTYRSGSNNPYFDRYEKINMSTRDIFNADVTASYQIVKWLKTTFRTGLDFYTDQGKQRVSWGSYVSLGNTPFPGNAYPWNGTTTGAYNSGKTQGFSINSDLMFMGDRTIDKLSVEYLFGGAINFANDETLYGMTSGGISIPGFYSLKASVNPATVGEYRQSRQVNSLYGRLAFSWDRLI